MRSIVLLLLFASAWSSTVARADPALWRLRGPIGETVLVFGTLHLLRSTDQWDSKRLIEAIDRAEIVYTELVLDDATNRELVALMQQKGFREGPGLFASLEIGDASALRAAARDVGVQPRVFDGMQAWYAALNVTLLKLRTMGADPQYGAETLIMQETEARRLEHRALETPSDQIDVFAALPGEIQKALLHDALATLDDYERQLGDMIGAWSRGDVEALATQFEALELGSEEFSEKLLYARNRAWAETLMEVASPGEEILAAVGTAHLVGENDLIDLFVAAGWTAERLDGDD